MNAGYVADLPEISKARGNKPYTNTLIRYIGNGFTEVAACNDFDVKKCIFLFKKNNEKLTVTTYGYPARIVKIERCKRTKWKKP